MLAPVLCANVDCVFDATLMLSSCQLHATEKYSRVKIIDLDK